MAYVPPHLRNRGSGEAPPPPPPPPGGGSRGGTPRNGGGGGGGGGDGWNKERRRSGEGNGQRRRPDANGERKSGERKSGERRSGERLSGGRDNEDGWSQVDRRGGANMPEGDAGWSTVEHGRRGGLASSGDRGPPPPHGAERRPFPREGGFGGGSGSGGGGGGGGHHSSRKPKGAPSRFGSIGRAMDGALRDGEDVPGGKRVDAEGMVYEMVRDGSVQFYQDRGRKYPFKAGPEALPLLRGLLSTNHRVFAINRVIVEATGDAAETIRHGEDLYANKPTMKAHHGALGTWSDEEYAHPGLQAVYLRLKSFQRFTESWALFERAARRGVFDKYLNTSATLHVASLGGGPGYELLALEWFLDYWAATKAKTAADARAWLLAQTYDGAGGDGAAAVTSAAAGVSSLSVDVTDSGSDAPATVPPLKLVSLDLQPSWEPYVLALPCDTSKAAYSFGQWNIKGEVDALAASKCASLELGMISNVLVYCTDEATADVLTALLTEQKMHAILVNERGAEQKMVEMLQRRGVVVVRLMDQSGGRDDRQLILLPPGTPPPPAPTPAATAAAAPTSKPQSQDVRSMLSVDAAASRYEGCVFPNVPYEEKKYA